MAACLWRDDWSMVTGTMQIARDIALADRWSPKLHAYSDLGSAPVLRTRRAGGDFSVIPCVTVVSVVTTRGFLSVALRKISGMGSSSREEIVEVFTALDANLDRLCELTFDVFTIPEQVRALERLERAARRLRAPQHTLINQLGAQASDDTLGGTLRTVLADRLRITKGEAGRRIDEAANLGPRRALSGEPLAPVLTATATAQRDGLIGDGHIKIIRAFFSHLPAEVDLDTREAADADLADKARQYRPDELATYAQRIMDWLHPDGDFSDQERARKRGITLGKQDYDGMSRLSGYLTPEARATFEPVLAKLAAPGACNPDDQNPVIDGAPDADAAKRGTRSQAQRNHDGLLAGLRALLASGKLGQHNGLPASIVVTATLAELQAAAGKGRTGGGSVLPIKDVIRLASHAHHYLALFDQGKPLALYHAKRLASPAQRIMLYAKDRGATRGRTPSSELTGRRTGDDGRVAPG